MDFQTAFNKSAALCARQERCISEIEDKLLLLGVEPGIVANVIKKLVDEQYIDENRFAGFYARDKFRINKWGKQKIAWNLRRKRIDNEIINAALDTLDNEVYSDTLLALLKTREKVLASRDKYYRKAALTRLALSRGFEHDEIIRALNSL